MSWLRGTDLHLRDQAKVLAQYIHRYTGDHTPDWAQGKEYPLQFHNDADWLEHTQFVITKHGRLDGRVRRCSSLPTWPGKKK